MPEGPTTIGGTGVDAILGRRCVHDRTSPKMYLHAMESFLSRSWCNVIENEPFFQVIIASDMDMSSRFVAAFNTRSVP
ncbi:hypothetical protein K443DRAFT_6660 [Laccaria amethystina LaAM-08-1]|uniref:Uncharacterized protein n=1 Tax=Laccaria amethystina LaAM-08-1 TaxID=1095629 RepID=A0A0C9XJR2_9AGAR|nr:hypothetical protein K443DRAFT_6660 [Laccaria amethystina LaAM-08-1]